MRNLKYLLLLGLFGLSPTIGCTVTTSDNAGVGGTFWDEGGAGGTGTTGGGTTGNGGSTVGVAGATTTTAPAFTAANCPAAAATPPTGAIADITPKCIECVYTTACADAVVCHNSGTCMADTLKALECIALNYTFYTAALNADGQPVDLCQRGLGEAQDYLGGMTVKSTDPNPWLGAAVPGDGTQVVSNCQVECQLVDPPTP